MPQAVTHRKRSSSSTNLNIEKSLAGVATTGISNSPESKNLMPLINNAGGMTGLSSSFSVSNFQIPLLKMKSKSYKNSKTASNKKPAASSSNLEMNDSSSKEIIRKHNKK